MVKNLNGMKIKMNTKPKLLLTGATGFLGSRILPCIMEKYDITCLVREGSKNKLKDFFGIRIAIGDITSVIPPNKYDAILHMAAITKLDENCNDNVIGTTNIIDYALKNKIKRLYYLSTAYVCGKHVGKFNKNDFDLGQKFNNDYEISKFESEKIVRQYNDKLEITIFRPSIIYDSDNLGIGFNYIVGAFIKGYLDKFPGNKENIIYLVHVKKVIQTILANMNEQSIGKTIPIIDSVKLGTLVEKYAKIFNREYEFVDIEKYEFKNEKLKKLEILFPYLQPKVIFEN